MQKTVHVVWDPVTGPVAVYDNPSLAFAHAEGMVGVLVSHCEYRVRLPKAIIEDRVSRQYDTDDITPIADIPPVRDPGDDNT